MNVVVDFRVLELLCGRLCHELVSPVGAINNGVELLDDEDPEFVKEAMGLIGQSARKAGQRLQFYRFAYGTSGGGAASGAALGGRELSLGLLDGGKVRCEWPPEAASLPVAWQRLACNMVVLAAEALPRGGAVHVHPLRDGASGVEVTAEGESVNVSAELQSAFADIAVGELTARTVQAFYTARLAQQMGARLALALPSSGRVVLTAAMV